MVNKISFTLLTSFLVLTCQSASRAQDELRVWNEFVMALKNGTITVDKIRPYDGLGETYKPILLGYIDSLRAEAETQDWNVRPEIVQTQNRIQYLFPWITKGQRVSYCFSFIVADTLWYFQHLEAIFVRLDKIPPLPVSQFPDISEAHKVWAREEIYWSFIVLNIYLPIAKEMGRQSALDLLKDGGGYFVGARSWIPFASPHKSFILYLCWEQANLRGNQVTLEKLNDNEAIVHLSTHFFNLYFTATHLKPRIPLEEYRQIFETIWHDRASSAGWNLKIQYTPDYVVTFHFTRSDSSADTR